MAGDVPQVERPVSGDGVQPVNVGEPAVVVLVVETRPIHPGVRLILKALYFGLQQSVELLEAAGWFKVDRGQAEAPPGGVAVRVDETWNHGGSVQHFDAGRGAAIEFFVESGYPSTEDSNAVRGGAAWFQGENVGIGQDQVELHLRR